MKKTEGAKFVRYFGPVLNALRELGGSGTPSEVTTTIAKMLEIPEAEQNELLKSGTPRLANQIAWARNYLKLEGYIDSAKKGVWVLTEAGRKTKLSEADARKVFLPRAIYSLNPHAMISFAVRNFICKSLNKQMVECWLREESALDGGRVIGCIFPIACLSAATR